MAKKAMSSVMGRAVQAAIAAGALLPGCAQMAVQRVATPDAATAVFHLQGAETQALHREATRRCPAGYDVLRDTHRAGRLHHDEVFLVRWWNRGAAYFDDENNRAQLTVSCKVSPGAP